jgi:hypothetical protein
MPTQHHFPSAFDGLRAVSDTGLVTFDGTDHATVAWSRVMLITAQMGQQHYDMTRCLRIDSDRQRSVFLPESEETWTPFLTAMTKHLPDVIPLEIWGPRLLAEPQEAILIYGHPDLPKKYSDYEEAFEWFLQRHPHLRR